MWLRLLHNGSLIYVTLLWQSHVRHAEHLPPHTSLCLCVCPTHLGYLRVRPCSLIHLPELQGECHVSAVTQRLTNKLRWERLGSVVGTLLPSLLSLPENQCCLREGPPAARCLNEYQTKTLATRWVTRVNVGFSVLFCLPPSFFSIHGWRTALHFGRAEKIKNRDTEKKQTVKVWELFLFSFFSFQELLSVLTLLTQVFVHLWHRISGSASSLCAKISTVNYV